MVVHPRNMFFFTSWTPLFQHSGWSKARHQTHMPELQRVPQAPLPDILCDMLSLSDSLKAASLIGEFTVDVN